MTSALPIARRSSGGSLAWPNRQPPRKNIDAQFIASAKKIFDGMPDHMRAKLSLRRARAAADTARQSLNLTQATDPGLIDAYDPTGPGQPARR